MDDFVLNVRQIGQYPLATGVTASDVLLIQQNGLGAGGGPYASIKPLDLLTSTFLQASTLRLPPTATFAWNGATFGVSGGSFVFSNGVSAPTFSAPQILLNGLPVATQAMLADAFDAIVNNTVHSVNGRRGDVQLLDSDILRAGGVLATNPHFNGVVTAPTIWNPHDCTDAVATTGFVQSAICNALESGHVVLSYNGRGGNVIPIADDVTKALTVSGQWGLANTPPSGDVSKRIANTAFVDDALAVMGDELRHDFSLIADQLDQKYAPLDSPQFIGIPTAPTADQAVNSGQLATTAFVHAAVTASTTGVSSWNGRTGSVTMDGTDIGNAGGALLASPAFTGTPQAPTAAPGTANTQIATTAYVVAAIAAMTAGVTSFNTRTGAVTLTTADVQAVGGAPIASPNFTGTPTAPTPAAASNNTSIATTAYVTAAISALPAPVTSFNGRTGAINFQASDVSAVGGALLASPQFTGNVTAPTATAGTSNTQVATTAFVAAAVSAATAGVASFNGRTGAVTLTGGDVTAAGGALLAGPTFTGVPAAPTASLGTNTTQLATTAYVQAALAAAPGGVSSFNGRTGAITFLAADVSAVGGALLSSPAFSGNPTAPTPAPGDNDTSIATTAFVMTALAAGGGVTSFNGRAGVVTLSLADVTGAGGAPLASPAFTGTPTAPTPTPATDSSTRVATTAFVQSRAGAQPGTYVLIQSQTITTPAGAVEFIDQFSNAYDEFLITVVGLLAANATAFNLMGYLSTDGVSFPAANYQNAFANVLPTGSFPAGGGTLTYMNLSGASDGNTYPPYIRIQFSLPWVAGNIKMFMVDWVCYSTGNSGVFRGLASAAGTSPALISNPIRGLRFVLSSAANIVAGTFNLYGVKK